MLPRYINPYTDFGFKRLFGEEANKDLLLDFLNELLRDEEGLITSISYNRNEHLGQTELDRKAIFDIYCENEKGEKFIVEMQKSKQNFFKDRSLFYATFPIQEQAKRGGWNYELKAVYSVAILDFIFDEGKHEADKFRYNVKLADIDTNEVFYDKLSFVYLEMPKFNKTIDQLENRFDKWLYILKNIQMLDEMPQELHGKIFDKFFETAEIAKFSHKQQFSYQQSLKYYLDLKNSIDTAHDEGKNEGFVDGLEVGLEQGREEGLEKGREEAILNGHKNGFSVEQIVIFLNISKDNVRVVLQKHGLL